MFLLPPAFGLFLFLSGCFFKAMVLKACKVRRQQSKLNCIANIKAHTGTRSCTQTHTHTHANVHTHTHTR